MKYRLVPEEPTEEMIRVGVDRAYTPDAGVPEVYKAMLAAAPSHPAPAKDRMSEREKKLMEAARKALPILRDAIAMNVSGDLREFGGGFADRLAYDAVEEALAAYDGKEEG